MYNKKQEASKQERSCDQYLQMTIHVGWSTKAYSAKASFLTTTKKEKTSGYEVFKKLSKRRGEEEVSYLSLLQHGSVSRPTIALLRINRHDIVSQGAGADNAGNPTLTCQLDLNGFSLCRIAGQPSGQDCVTACSCPRTLASTNDPFHSSQRAEPPNYVNESIPVLLEGHPPPITWL